MSSSQPFILFVLGGPGAGKGTQCTRLVADFNFVHLSAGDVLREEMAREGSEFCELIGKCIKEGSVVPVKVTLALLKAAMERTPDQPFLIDGYPRAMIQAEEFEKQITSCKAVLYFKCTEAAMRERLLIRGKSSGRTDDNEESIVKRFVTFNETSYPVIQHYQERNLVVEIDTEDTPDNVYKVTHEAVAKLLNKEKSSGQADVSTEASKEDEISPIETKKSKKKNKKKKNKGSVSSQIKPSDNETDNENASSAPAPLTDETFKPIETIKEVEVESVPEETIVSSTEDTFSQLDTSAVVGLESNKPLADAKDISVSEANEPNEIVAPVVLEQIPEATDKLADSSAVTSIDVSEQEKEITVLTPTEALFKKEVPIKADGFVKSQEISEDGVFQNKNLENPEADFVDQVQEHFESKVVPAKVPQNIFTPDIPVVADQALNNDVSIGEHNSASISVPVTIEEHVVKSEGKVSDAPVISLCASVLKEQLAHVESIAQDSLEKPDESFTIPAIPTELETKRAEIAQELMKENKTDILKDIPSHSEAFSPKSKSVSTIPEVAVVKSDDFLGSFADQIQFSEFEAPDTAFSLPSFNSLVTEKTTAQPKPSVEVASNLSRSTESQLKDNFTSLNDKVESKFSPVVISSAVTNLPASIDEKQKLAETAITTKIKAIQDQVESKLVPTSESVQQLMTSQPEAVQSALVKEIPAEVNLPISASITELEKINNLDLSTKAPIGDINSQITDQVSGINSSVTGQVSAINSSVTDKVSAVDSSVTDKVSAIDSSVTDKLSAIDSSVTDKVSSIDASVKDQLSSIKLPESAPVNEDSLPKLPTPATLSEKVRDIPLSISDVPSSSATPDRSLKSKPKKKAGCFIM